MRTISEIIALHGGLEAIKADHIRIEAPGFMPLVIEHVGRGPRGLDALSIAHYFNQGGDQVVDPEVVVEVIPDANGTIPPDVKEWGIVSIRHPFGPVVEACWRDDAGRILLNERTSRDVLSFLNIWIRNLKAQGYIAAYQAAGE
jgi:hypothetical protein